MARQDGSDRTGSAHGPRVIAAEDARQGRIVLTTRRRQVIFLTGIIGGVVLALVVAALAG
mgnify:CR=1 FL=1